jgi:hypothetical protein
VVTTGIPKEAKANPEADNPNTLNSHRLTTRERKSLTIPRPDHNVEATPKAKEDSSPTTPSNLKIVGVVVQEVILSNLPCSSLPKHTDMDMANILHNNPTLPILSPEAEDR